MTKLNRRLEMRRQLKILLLPATDRQRDRRVDDTSSS